jgi:hypothetical protein
VLRKQSRQLTKLWTKVGWTRTWSTRSAQAQDCLVLGPTKNPTALPLHKVQTIHIYHFNNRKRSPMHVMRWNRNRGRKKMTIQSFKRHILVWRWDLVVGPSYMPQLIPFHVKTRAGTTVQGNFGLLIGHSRWLTCPFKNFRIFLCLYDGFNSPSRRKQYKTASVARSLADNLSFSHWEIEVASCC